MNGTALLHAKRQGQRQFKANEAWGKLLVSDHCKSVSPQPPNFLHPISGTMGVHKLIATFIDLSEQKVPKDVFVETLIFTTEVNANATLGLKVNPEVPKFKLVSGSLTADSGRSDVHKIIISLAFPHSIAPDAISGVDRYDGDLNAPFQRPPAWRARYNLCVADARAREDEHKSLRLEAPEIYCIKYADQFAPTNSDDGTDRTVITLRLKDRSKASTGARVFMHEIIPDKDRGDRTPGGTPRFTPSPKPRVREDSKL